jgi:hypothetical protein
MGMALLYMNFVCAAGTMAAGMLQRRYGTMRAALVPHFELVLAATLILSCFSNAFWRVVAGWSVIGWHYYVPPLAFLSLAVVSVLASWRWPLRLAIHIAWIVSLVVFSQEYWRNVPLPD